jgi:calcium-translocating P-type ATPase
MAESVLVDTVKDTVQQAIYGLPAEDVYPALQSQPEGLTQAEAAGRLQRYGLNTIHEIKRTPLIVKFAANFTHLMALLLWAGGLVALIAQLPQLAVAIWLVILINGVFSFWQEYRAEKATEALRRMLPNYARVMRDGEERRILAEELVPGDVILLAEGDHISADARLVEQAELYVDQSTLTGESTPLPRTEDIVDNHDTAWVDLANLVFAGTNVTSGTGKAVVFATAMQTQFGHIAHLTQSLQEELSPLQKEMMVATRWVTIIAVSVGLVFLVLAVLAAGLGLAQSFIFALGMIVAFVPEGLLPTVTLSLAMAVRRMAARHALIKRLSAVETLGCTTVICTDKTGTLTENEMTVTDLWLAGKSYTITGVGYDPIGAIYTHEQKVTQPPEDLCELLRAAALCNNAHLIAPNGESPQWTILGDPTEAALKVAALKAGLNLDNAYQHMPRLAELPFDSSRKRMSTIHKIQGCDPVAFIKGAPQEVLELCESVVIDGVVQPLDAAWRASILAANDAYARGGLRVLAVAKRSLTNVPLYLNHHVHIAPEALEQQLTFLGLVAMLDPPRPEVKTAVETCHRAGIRVIMITGDYGLTAESIARRIGIIRGDKVRIVTGVDLRSISDEHLKRMLDGEVIFARVAPQDKLRVVTALQALGQVVAATGDGVNDAPALKKADIGVAMGITGTDVAKEAADMVLTDDNFASIVNAVEEGRAVYANIKKFITYIFTSNTPEAVPFILFAFSGGRIPLGLNIMQILSIDLGTDMLPALALGVEAPEPGLMNRPPRNLKEHVITRGLLLRAYAWLGLLQSLAAMAAFYFMYWTNGYWGQWIDLPSQGALYEAATAMTLGAVVATQIGNLFAQRTERVSVFRINFFKNRLIWVGIISEIALVFAIIYLPFLQGVFGTAAFPLSNWLFLFAWTPLLLLADELRKAILRWRESNQPTRNEQ